MYLCVDQYGIETVLQDVKRATLKETFNGGRIDKMYQDRNDGTTYHSGYVIGQGHGNYPLWVSIYHMVPLGEAR